MRGFLAARIKARKDTLCREREKMERRETGCRIITLPEIGIYLFFFFLFLLFSALFTKKDGKKSPNACVWFSVPESASLRSKTRIHSGYVGAHKWLRDCEEEESRARAAATEQLKGELDLAVCACMKSRRTTTLCRT